MSTAPLILVVDDNPSNTLLLTRALENADYTVLTASDGFKAVEAARRHRPDLILMDMMMPERDGLETCAILKAQEETAAIPVIFVTALSDTTDIVKALATGGCDYITKPFRTDEVLARVSVHVRLRQAERELRLQNKRLEELTDELAILSRTDALTELLNRRTWEEVAEREHERFQRSECPYSIIMIDVDCFKAFNDARGHQAGDECLRRIAESIASVCRRVDSVGRYGGEEFVVLAPETGSDAAIKLAERVRRGIWELGIPHPASLSAGRVTSSLGVATSNGDAWEKVLKAADDALYVAKGAGRNMVFGGDGATPRTVDRTSAGNMAPARGGDSEDGARRARVLVVDDDRTNRVICKNTLERADYQVSEACDGVAALENVSDAPPDVIILDVMMPKMDGLECTRRLKANPDTRDIPIIIVSALAKNDDILAGLQAGADEYLTKPVRTTELTLRVRSMVRQSRNRRDLLHSYQVRGEHVRNLMCLVDFCRAIGTSRDLDDLLEHTVSAVADLACSRRVSIMLPDREQRRLRIVKSIGMDDELAATVTVPLGAPTAGQVFVSAKAVVINTDTERPAGTTAYDSRFFASVPLISAPLDASGEVVGVLNVTERIGSRPFEPQELEYVELIAKVAATAIHDVFTREAHAQASDSITIALAKLAEHRDNDTGKHLDRVTRYCDMLAQELRKLDRFREQIDDAFLHDMIRSAPLHDIGKVAVPDHILLHPGKLNPEQMTVMRTHASVGAKTIRTLVERTPGVGFLQMAADIAHYHHERYDGLGYPEGLKGDAIPLAARITALADVYDAITTKRVYKEAVSHDRAIAIILEASGTQFDPDVVEAFTKCEQEFARLVVTMADGTPAEHPAQTTLAALAD